MPELLEKSDFEGIILRIYPSGDSDAILHILSSAVGKLAIFGAKIRSPKKGTAPLDVLDWGHFEIKEGRGNLPFLKAFHPRSSFHQLRNNFDKLLLASLICDVFDTGLPDGEISASAFESLWNALSDLNEAESLQLSFRITYNALKNLMIENGIFANDTPPSSHALLKMAIQLENYTGRKLLTKEQLPLAIQQLKIELSKKS